jgi:hypothetical protein
MRGSWEAEDEEDGRRPLNRRDCAERSDEAIHWSGAALNEGIASPRSQ